MANSGMEIPANMNNLYIVDDEYQTSGPQYKTCGEEYETLFRRYYNILWNIIFDKIIEGQCAEKLEEFLAVTCVLDAKMEEYSSSLASTMKGYITATDRADKEIY